MTLNSETFPGTGHHQLDMPAALVVFCESDPGRLKNTYEHTIATIQATIQPIFEQWLIDHGRAHQVISVAIAEVPTKAKLDAFLPGDGDNSVAVIYSWGEEGPDQGNGFYIAYRKGDMKMTGFNAFSACQRYELRSRTMSVPEFLAESAVAILEDPLNYHWTGSQRARISGLGGCIIKPQPSPQTK